MKKKARKGSHKAFPGNVPSEGTEGEAIVQQWLREEGLDVTPNGKVFFEFRKIEGAVVPPRRRKFTRPDAVVQSLRLAVFVDGRYWHDPEYVRAKNPKNLKGWVAKAQKNAERDRVTDANLAMAGWRIVRVWHEDVIGDNGDVAREATKKRILAATRVNFHDDFELVYMRHRSIRRAQKPLTPAKIKEYSPQVKAISRAAFNKYRYAMGVLGADEEDMFNVGLIYLIIFVDKWEVEGDPKKNRRVLWQFLNQRFGEWAMIAAKKNYNIRGNLDTAPLTVEEFTGVVAGPPPSPVLKNPTEAEIQQAEGKAHAAETEADRHREEETARMRKLFEALPEKDREGRVVQVASSRHGDPVAREQARAWCNRNKVDWEMLTWMKLRGRPDLYAHYVVVKYDPSWRVKAQGAGIDTSGWPKDHRRHRHHHTEGEAA